MIPLIFILASLVLFAGFLVLTVIETRRNSRLFAATRAKLDREVGRAHFILEHVDFPGFLRDSSRIVAVRATHEFVRGILIAVRFVERLLTRLVKALREHSAVSTAAAIAPAVRESHSPFIRAIRHVKDELRNGRVIHSVGH
jgi:hypothetical protein